MAHYDIYRSLGLDRSTPTAELDRQLADRLAAVPQDDTAAVDELTTARAVLGDDTRRSLYDQRLDDPTAPEIDVASLKDLAALEVGGQPGQAGAFVRTAGSRATDAGRKVQNSFRQSRGLAIGITAAVTAVVVLLVGWGLGALSGSKSQDFSSPIKVVNEMLEQDSADDLRSWLQDNTVHETRDDVLSSMNVSDSGSSSFSGLDSHFDGSGLEATTGLSVGQLAISAGESVKDMVEDAEEEGISKEEAESIVVIGIQDDTDNYKGIVTLVKRDGDYRITDISRY
ncbi:hypothetical protein [Corynebacterium sp.]|jgi:hypothetical protein|uniref:hypothetical protein n=1 Tax=Corynebacterium sp. TaxID=1720 RepID=UPI0025C38DE2|nr:hypothetical protein [Corynebacterium sp.]